MCYDLYTEKRGFWLDHAAFGGEYRVPLNVTRYEKTLHIVVIKKIFTLFRNKKVLFLFFYFFFLEDNQESTFTLYKIFFLKKRKYHSLLNQSIEKNFSLYTKRVSITSLAFFRRE